MPTELTLHTRPEVPLEAECLTPHRLAGLSAGEVENLDAMHGNRKVRIGDFFKVLGKGDDDVALRGDLSLVKLIGAQMSHGTIRVEGNAGMHLGWGMSGGEILVDGDAHDWVGPEMSGGRIIVKGDAGHMVGSAYRGQASGICGGEILVHGNVRNEAGGAMRRGLIAIGGDAGDFTGVNAIAGTIFVFGSLGIRAGAGMKRASIITMNPAETLPTYGYACTYRPPFIPLYLAHLRRLGFAVEGHHIAGQYQRWSGDGLELNKGEILLLQPRSGN